MSFGETAANGLRSTPVAGLVAFLGAAAFLIAVAFAAPASASSLADTTYADFSAGSTGAGTYVAESSDGEVILAPSEGSEFPGSALPPGWFKAPWAVGGDATVSGGQLTVDGARTGTSATYGPGRSLEFSATFSSAAPFSHIGFGTDYNAPPWAMFSVKPDGNLYARTDNGSGGVMETMLPAPLIDSSHIFRIEWAPAGVDYYVDGSLVASHGISIGATPLRVLASDLNVGGSSLPIDWARMTPNTSPGTFTSRILDAGEPVVWGSLGWTADEPAGTSVTLSVRTGNTPVPDGTWTAFDPIASPGSDVPGFSRYAQYRAVLTSGDLSITPTLRDVEITYTIDLTPPEITINEPSAKERYLLHESITPDFSCTDPLAGSPPAASGVDTCTASPIDNENLGPHVFEVTATDNAGNTATKKVAYVIDPPNYGDFIGDDNPLAYYRLDEPVGSAQMVDRSGNGYHGTYQNGIALGRNGATACERRPHPPRACELANPPENKAGYFPARDGHGYVNGITAPKNAYTMEAWVKPADGNDMMVMSHGGGGQLFIKDGKLAFRQVQDTIFSNAAVEPGTWSHVAATWDGHNTRLYVNGHQVAHSSTANKPPSGTSTFFVGYGEMAPWFHGDLDEVAYFDRALGPHAFVDRHKVGKAKDNPSIERGNSPLNTEGPFTDPAAPKNNGLYAPTKTPDASFSCTDPDDLPGDSDVASCTATVDGNAIANGVPLPDSIGTHSFVVTAIDKGGNTYIHPHTYTVKPFSWIYGHDNPIAYYRLGDGSNQPMVDASGNNRHGGYKNDQDSGPTGISGDGDKARDFFGAGGYGYVNGISAPRYQTTLEAWVKPLGSLDPTSSEFDGSSLPGGWSQQNIWNPGGSVNVSGGQLVVDGASAGTDATYGSGRTLEFEATFAPGTPFAHAGFGVDYNSPPWVMFSVKSDGELYARTDNNAGGVLETHLGTGYLGSSHRFRIEWTATQVVYYVDGTVVASHNVSFGATQMRPLASEYNSGGGDLRIDWLRMSPLGHPDASIVGHGDAGEIYIKGGYFHFRHMDKTVTSSVPVKSGEWQQVVGTWDGVDIRIYVDGIEVGKTEATKRPSSVSTFYVGYGELAPWFRGAIDEVAYYDTALPPARVYQHFLADPPPSDQGDPGRPGDASISGGSTGEDPPASENPPTSGDSEPGSEATSGRASAQCVQATDGLKKAKKAHRRANKKLANARRNGKKGLRKKVRRTGKRVAIKRSFVRSSC